jgi:hypothetical protein
MTSASGSDDLLAAIERVAGLLESREAEALRHEGLTPAEWEALPAAERAALDRASDALARVHRSATARVSPEERRALLGVLERMTADLDPSGGPILPHPRRPSV